MTTEQEQKAPENQQAAAEQAAAENHTAVEPLDEEHQLKADLEQAQAELADAKDQMVRALADAQNARRRAEKDVSNTRMFALEGFSRDLLPVLDNLERAMDSVEQGDDASKAIAEGVELTLKSFLDVLHKHKVEQVNPLSEPFDPDYHEAISMVENPEVEPNTVLEVVQKGYTLNGRLVRAAMVVVSR